MKRGIACFTIIGLLLMALVGCRPAAPQAPEPDLYQQIRQRMASLQTFRATATVTYISNKGTTVYETTQHGRITGEYRVEVTGPERVAGNVTSSDGQHIYQFNSRVNGRVTILARENKERSEIFLTAFIRNWARDQAEGVAAASSAEDTGENRFTVLEAQIPGEHPYLAVQRLWINNETLNPEKLIIFDPNGTERVIVSFSNFDYNIELADALFTV